MRFLIQIFTGFALACIGPCNITSFNQNYIAMAFTQPMPKDKFFDRAGNSQIPLKKRLSGTKGLIPPPKGIDPGLLIPLFLAPVLWRDAAETDYLSIFSAYTADQKRFDAA